MSEHDVASLSLISVFKTIALQIYIKTLRRIYQNGCKPNDLALKIMRMELPKFRTKFRHRLFISFTHRII